MQSDKMQQNKRSFKHWKVPLYSFAVLICISCFILSITVETETYIYVGATFMAFFLNLESKFVIERSNLFLSSYLIIALISCVVSYFIFIDYALKSPRGAGFYAGVIFILIYIFISIYDKIFNIRFEVSKSDDE